jgi:hypothetical protein
LAHREIFDVNPAGWTDGDGHPVQVVSERNP